MNLTRISEIKPLMERHGFRFSKSLGQNFLINDDIPRRIVENAGIDQNTSVLEIGPGIGCLTCRLAEKAAKVTAVEIDRRLLPVLEETLSAHDNIEIINADILKIDVSELCAARGITAVCANLPYYITTPVIMRLLESNTSIKTFTVMVQKEVARRFTSEPGTKEYGAITLAVNYYSRPEILFDVSPGNFIPAPNVFSSVVKFTVRSSPRLSCDKKILFRIIKAGFSKRRKTLANALFDELKEDKDDIVKKIEEAGFPADIRAEKLSLEDFGRLTEVFCFYK